MGILNDNHLYGQWRKGVKDQMLARGFRKVPTFPDHHFQQIVASMRTLRPACHSLVTAVAANNRPGMPLIDEAVVQLVKACEVKLRTTVKNCSTGLAPLCQNGVFYDQIMLSNRLLPPNAPDQSGPATPVPNPGPVPQSVSPAYAPKAQNLSAHHVNYLQPAQGVKAQCIAAQGLPAQNVPNHRGNYLTAAQGVAVQGVAAQGVLVQNVSHYHRNYPSLVQNVPGHHGNYLPPAQGVPGQNVPDDHGNYPPRGQSVPAHPAIYTPTGQNILGSPANSPLPGQNAPALPAVNPLPNPLAHGPLLNYYARDTANAPAPPAIHQMCTPDPSTETLTPSLVRSNAPTLRVLPRGGNFPGANPMPTG